MKLGVVVAAVLSLLVTAEAGAAVGHRVAERDATAVRAFWTPERVAQALRNDPEFGRRPAPKLSNRRTHHRPVTSPHPQVGKLIGLSPQGKYSCTGTVIDTASLRLVLTAAHCIYYQGIWARSILFIPDYKNGARPYGTYTTNWAWVTDGWYRSSGIMGTHYDIGILVMQRTAGGKKIGETVGAVPVRTYPGRRSTTDLYGYPGAAMRAEVMRTCRSRTRPWSPWFLPGPTGLISRCNMAAGSSGGPWISSYLDEDGESVEMINGLTSTGFTMKGVSYLTSPFLGWHLASLIRSAEGG